MEPNEVIFGADTPVCKEFLNEPRNQFLKDDIAYRKMLVEDKLRKVTWGNIVVDVEMLIEKLR